MNVAVFDTGIDLDHPDLAANIEGGYMAITNNDLYRYNRSYDDDNGHGTHVAGTIAAVDNLYGVVGVAPAADLYAVKVLDKYGSGWMSDIARAVYWAIATHADANPNNDIQVINMSLGSNDPSTTLRTALADAEAAGILLVAAAGNDGAAVDYPAAESQVIAVAATDSSNRVPSWSSQGPQVELAAPGAAIVSTYRGGLFAWKSGTSMATPHVSGAAALVWAARPWLTAAEVRAVLDASAEDMGTAGWDALTGAGLVRPDRALGL
ncbi:MAG: S8 family peptidase [Thermoleophilia bacterium]